MTAPATDAKKASVFDDFVDIITSPAKVFERRQDGKFGTHLLVLTVVCVALFFIFKNAMEPIFDAEFSRQAAKMMEKNPNMSQDQLAAMQKMGGVFAGIGFAIFFPLGIIVTGFVLWLVGKAFGSQATVKQALQVGTLAQVPLIIGMILGAIQAMLMSPDQLNSQYSIMLSPARFMDPDTTSPALLGLVGRIDLIGIWVVIIMGIGLSIVGKIDRPRAWAAAAVTWIVAALPVLLPALIS
jgi:hypothetical protein